MSDKRRMRLLSLFVLLCALVCAQEFRATLDGVPVAVRALTLRGPSCVYDLVGVAPPDGLAALGPDFERFTGGFALARTP